MRKFTAVALATASLLPLASAFAQEAPADTAAATDNDEIVVQARRRDESVQDVPLSVQAVTGQELQKLEIRNFTDITKTVPGLQLASTGFATSAALRGINFDARASGASTSVEFYRNDAVITSGALFQAVYDIGQVEVLKGPQGTLRGRASPSGSITVTTRRPDLNEVGGYVSATAASRSKWNFNGALNVPVIADKLGIRVAGFTGDNHGNNVRGLNVRQNTINNDIYDKTDAIRASVRADPFDGVLVLDASYEAIKHQSSQFNQVQSLNDFQAINPNTGLANPASPRTITLNDRLGVGSDPSTVDQSYQLYTWQAKFRQWGQALTYVGSKQTVIQHLWGPGDGGGIFGTQTATNPFINAPAGLRINRLGQLTDSDIFQSSHELRLQNEDRVAGLFDYVVGAFTVSQRSPTVLTNGAVGSCRDVNGNLPVLTPGNPGATPPLSPVCTAPVSTGTAAFANGTFPTYSLDYLGFSGTYRYAAIRESSLFANLTVHIDDRTELSGGLRHIWYKQNSGTVSSISLVNPTTSGTTIQSRCYGNSDVAGCLPGKEATIYAASLKHNFTSDIMGYASFGTSWRPGNSLVGWGLGSGTTTTTGAFLDQFLNLPDETSKSFEIGFKTAWLDRRLKFNVSAFYQKFNNYPLFGAASVQTLSAPAGATLIRGFNFASPVSGTVKGVEAEMSFDITPNFYVAANLAFADSKAKNALVPCLDTDNDNRQDTTPLNPTGSADDVTRYNLWLSQIGTNQVDTCRIDASLSSQPRLSGSVQAEYSVPVSDWGSAYLRGFVTWKGDSANDELNLVDDVPAYALVDLFAGIRAQNGAWELGGYAKNLFNTRRVLTRASAVSTTTINGAGGTGTYNYQSVSTNDPREFGVSLRYAFGSR